MNNPVVVERELLERIVNTNMADYAVIAYQHKEIRAILAQPAEAEGDRIASGFVILDGMAFSKDEILAQRVDLCNALESLSAVTAERDRLAEQASKFRLVERAMEALACDEREGGIVTAASLILISSAHRMNAKRGVIDQEGVTLDGGCIGDWRVTIERISPAMAAKEA